MQILTIVPNVITTQMQVILGERAINQDLILSQINYQLLLLPQFKSKSSFRFLSALPIHLSKCWQWCEHSSRKGSQ